MRNWFWTLGLLTLSAACSQPPAIAFTTTDGTSASHQSLLQDAVRAWNEQLPDGQDDVATVGVDQGVGEVRVDFHEETPCESRPLQGELGGFEGQTIDVWSDCGDREFVLYVTLHEVGHALGLEHSDTRDSVMWGGPDGAHSLTESDRVSLRAHLGLQ